MFWFKKKKIVVDCFIDNKFLVDNVSIAPSIKNTPEWWKSIPSQVEVQESHNIIIETSTIKRCIGFLDLYKNSFTLPLWSDVCVNVNEHEISWKFADGLSRMESHNPIQYGNNFSDLRHIKIMCPWILNEKTGCNFIYMQSTWSMLDSELKNLIMPPAILNFKHQHYLHVNIFLPSKPQSYFVKVGTPLVHLIPMTENEVEFKSHHIDSNEYQTMSKTNRCLTFSNGYNFAKKKSEERENEKKTCPFHFK
jgi:hypothetical protein